MPANSPRQVPPSGSAGVRRVSASAASRASQRGSASAARGAPATVTKLGQKPFRQERSTLQLVGLTRRLRPSAVCTGSMAMQFDCTVQSPQFSHTASLIVTERAACSILPRLRRRRFSVAQTWS